MTFNRTPNAPSHQLIGTSPKIKQVIRMIEKVAPTDSTVLIYGESGTGKELVARAIYANSRQKDGPFFAVDCGTLSSSLLESELFGHTRGAFTGAHKDKEGIFKLARGGTVFLDEISNISLEIQSKLLRFLETREFLPVGAVKTVQVSVRLIFATNQNLEELVTAGSFRADFYYRIYVYPIMIPPLRERTMDILPIAYYFLTRFNQTMGKGITGFSEDAGQWMTAGEWPGNIRQLRNVIERAVISCEGDLITIKDLPVLSAGEDKGPVSETVPATNEELKRWKKEVRKKAVDQMEREFVLKALVKNSWNVTRAAGQVGLQRTNFQGLMKKHGIKLSVGSRQD
jgi:transcriptional regulator with GAF, ATPase, and Fis domain